MINQTAHFPGLTPQRLYDAFLSAKQHAAMTADGRQHVAYLRPDGSPTDDPQTGDRLFAFGRPDNDGQIEYRLVAQLLELIPDQRIVMEWRSAAWDAAVEPADGAAPSIVILRFANNLVGAEIRLDQVGVPAYLVELPDTGEHGHLEDIVNTHWSLLYWEPMKQYLATTAS